MAVRKLLSFAGLTCKMDTVMTAVRAEGIMSGKVPCKLL